ncbi:MAG TPA: DUF5681 domain-containing protein [Magnetospirillum sp.]|nr:DUF5681 domain-containing protein [Magnetospirillum sp.]
MSGDCKVGYGKPPKHSQFKKGQSGNPAGRPKREKTHYRNVWEPLLKIMGQELMVTIGGKAEPMAAIDALYRQLFAKALKGDRRASTYLIERWEAHWTANELQKIEFLKELIESDADIVAGLQTGRRVERFTGD